jgi:hypothetical protein
MDKAKAIQAMRQAAEVMEHSNEPVVLPGWVSSCTLTPREQDIRAAAQAVLGQLTPDGDVGATVKTEQLGALVRYIADMMEE